MATYTFSDRNIGVNEAAQITGIAEATLRYWRHTKEGPRSFKIGRRVFYKENELRAWVAQQMEATTRGTPTDVPAAPTDACANCGVSHD